VNTFLGQALALFMMIGGALLAVGFAAFLGALFYWGESRNLMTLGLLIVCIAAALQLIGTAASEEFLQQAGQTVGMAGATVFGAGVISRFVVGVLAIFGIGPLQRRGRRR
jgi:hypothetical protein